MDVRIDAGATLTLHAGGQRVTLKALAAARVAESGGSHEAASGARIAVMGPTEALRLGAGQVEVVTPSGVVTLPGRAVDDGAGMVLRVGSPGPLTQRRREVRGDVELVVRVTMPGPAETPEHLLRVLRGRTRNLSAGGMLCTLDLGTSPDVHPGSLLDVDVELPEGGGLVATRVFVIQVTHFGLRGAFVGLEHVHAEKFARLVFARERERLAARRQRADLRAGTDAPVPGRDRSW
ncbi:hypothetical protein GCM10027446_00400 [Angustibacter peucedani]